MRLSDTEALAKLGHVCSLTAGTNRRLVLPRWWLKELAPPAGEASDALEDLPALYSRVRDNIERAFSDQLTSGKIIGWARRDTPVAPYQPLPADTWRVLCGRLNFWVCLKQGRAYRPTTKCRRAAPPRELLSRSLQSPQPCREVYP